MSEQKNDEQKNDEFTIGEEVIVHYDWPSLFFKVGDEGSRGVPIVQDPPTS